MTRMRLALTGLAAAAAAAAVLAAAGLGAGEPRASHRTSATAEIVFVRGQSRAAELYVVREDGTGLRRLTRNGVGEAAPAWSPDGRRIAFSRYVDGDDEVFVMDADGRNVRQLTRNRRLDLQPRWSPDGLHIAFASDRARPGEPELWIMRADGMKPRRLVRTVNHRAWQDSQFNPAWSPDGRRIIFSMAVRDGNPELFVVGVDGRGLRRLTRTGGTTETLGDDTMPHWSPDGATVAFVSNRERVTSDLWVMRPDGSGQRPLLRRARSDDWFPRFSADGARILFTDFPLGGGAPWVAVVRADGRNLRRLTRGQEADWAPVR